MGRIEDSLLGPGALPYRWRYRATFPALALCAVVTVGACFVEDVTAGGRLGVSLIGAGMFAFSLYANRALRRRASAPEG